MEAEIARVTAKSLTYKAGTKEDDPEAIGRLVLEFDASDADPAEVAALFGQSLRVTLSTPQLAMPLHIARITEQTLDNVDSILAGQEG